jgi:hypothetical protein
MRRTKRSPTSVLSLRVSDDVMRTLADRAKLEGRSVGTLARDLLERCLQEQAPVTPSGFVSMLRKTVEEMEAARIDWRINVGPGIMRSCWIDSYIAASETTRSPMIHDLLGQLRGLALPGSGNTEALRVET